jgi:DNA polymerase
MLDSKASRYQQLVEERKKLDLSGTGLHNPATVDNGDYDSDHIGPWTLWAHDLSADMMIVGQDWGDLRYFRENRGLDKLGNPTNAALMRLTESIGRPLPPPPSSGAVGQHDRSECGVWLTNALLFLKEGGLSAPVRAEWFVGASADFLRRQIDIVAPRVVVGLGSAAYDTVLAAHIMPKRRGPYRRTVIDSHGTLLSGTSATLIGVYHCGARVQNTLRSLQEQLVDWKRIGNVLASS